jgi:N-acetylglucosamine kinase-like BadF-type ATPase
MLLGTDVTEAEPPPAAGELLLVVDAGGTKTAAWLVASPATGAVVLGRGRSTAGNPLSVGFPEATRAIAEAVSAAKMEARLPHARVSRAVLSIAGAANFQLRDHFVQYSRETNLAGRIAIVSDVLPVLAAGTTQCVGIALIAGTGSVAFGRAADGRTALCGGWGYLLGDEGSGYAIGRAALQHALRNLELHAPRQPLTDAVLAAIGADSVMDITKIVYRSAAQRSAIAAVAPVVINHADAGDSDAQQILDAAAGDLARLAARAVRSLALTERPLPLAAGGGILTCSVRVQQQLQVELHRLGLSCQMQLVNEPLEGCMRLATAAHCAPLLAWA